MNCEQLSERNKKLNAHATKMSVIETNASGKKEGSVIKNRFLSLRFQYARVNKSVVFKIFY